MPLSADAKSTAEARTKLLESMIRAEAELRDTNVQSIPD